MQTKLTDLEETIYECMEFWRRLKWTTQEFIESFIKTELVVSDTELGIQRCHTALCPKPPPNANPRSIVNYFLEYKIKELVLRSVWRKREVHLKGKRVYFDQDYPAETQKKRKASQ